MASLDGLELVRPAGRRLYHYLTTTTVPKEITFMTTISTNTNIAVVVQGCIAKCCAVQSARNVVFYRRFLCNEREMLCFTDVYLHTVLRNLAQRRMYMQRRM